MKMNIDRNKVYRGTNWNAPENSYVEAFWNQNTSQFWLPEEVSLTQDVSVWKSLPYPVQLAYAKNLATLTHFDSHQGVDGIVHLMNSYCGDDLKEQTRAVLSFVSTMECVHAKSYSTIYSSYLSPEETLEHFEWADKNANLQKLMNIIMGNYKEMGYLNACKEYGFEEVDDLTFKVQQWKTMVTSVFLESYLFYTGFYYPLWFYGIGKLSGAGEIINLIVRDEQVHGLYISMLAKELWDGFSVDLKSELESWLYSTLEELYDYQSRLIEDIYGEVGLSHDVKVFARYNANKALMNLGFNPKWEEEEVNPVVLNGLNTESKSHDFFSLKGNGYTKVTTEELTDDDFDF